MNYTYYNEDPSLTKETEMTINLTKAALLVAVYFLYKNSLQMDEMRAQLRTANAKLNDVTVA